jgi:hypothetical protein
MIHDIKRYILNLVPSKPTLLELTVISITIDHQMAVIQVQVGKSFIEDVLLASDFGFNIITEKLRVHLGLSKPKHMTYNLHMANQTITKPLGVIKIFKFLFMEFLMH